MLLGSSPAVQQAISNGSGTLPGMPAAATFTFPSAFMSGLPSATIVLVVEVLGLVFIGLVSVAGFSVMAQRRQRALGMLSAIGATERNLRLVMITGGLVAGVAAALAGAVLGFAAWFAYVPALQQAAGHVVDAANLPWWAFAIGAVLAIATALGIVIALGMLAASVGLIRSETARDLRTLTATGASATTRRTITAATAAALGLFGAILGMAGAVIAGLAWAHSSLSASRNAPWMAI